MGLEVYLNDPGRVSGIGPEYGKPVRNGIAKYTTPHGSVRYVAYVNGLSVSALQIVRRLHEPAIIANVYTVPNRRREGWAAKLLAKARKDYGVVEHAPEHRLSDEGRAWRDKVKENPLNSYWYWIGGAATVFVGLFAFNRWSQSQIQSKIQANLPPGITINPPSASDTYVVPKSRESVNLSMSQMPKFNLHFVPNGSLTFTPSSGVIDVQLTDFGATVTAVGQGSATITIVYGNDTTGVSDAIIGIGVFA